MALGRLPTHPPLPPHLAFRHPVAATPLAGQEEVTAVSPLPPLFPHPACHKLGKRPRDQQGCHLTQLGPQPRRRGSHRAPIVTVTLRVSPAPPGWRRDRPPVGGGSSPRPKWDPGGITSLLRTGGHHRDTVTAPVPTDRVHQALGHLNLPELKLPLQPSPACPAAGWGQWCHRGHRAPAWPPRWDTDGHGGSRLALPGPQCAHPQGPGDTGGSATVGGQLAAPGAGRIGQEPRVP